MSEKLTREEWETYIEMHRRVIELAQVGHHEDCFIVPILMRTPTISVYSDSGVYVGRSDMSRVIHDPERDRADLIARLEATIAEAGEAGEGLRVTLDEPVQTASDDTVILRPTGEADVYSLHGGAVGYDGEWVRWSESGRETWLDISRHGKAWAAGASGLFASLTNQADHQNHPTLTAYLAAIPGDWRMEE